MSEIEELKSECVGYRARLEKIKSATNHVTPEEKEKVSLPVIKTIIFEIEWSLCFFLTCCTLWYIQVYKEREVYVKEWRKRKRLVMYRYPN